MPKVAPRQFLSQFLRLSLTLRLTLLFATAATGVLLLLGYWLSHAVEQHFLEMDQHFLADQIHQAEHHFAQGQTAAEVGAMLAHHQGVLLAIYADNGALLYHSSNGEIPVLINNSLLSQWQDQMGKTWRGMKVNLVATEQHPTLQLALAMNIEHHQHFMHSFHTTLMLGVIFSALFCGLLAWFAARRGLAPLHSIRQAVAQISPQDLTTRLATTPSTAIPPELAELVTTLNAMLARLEAAFCRLSDFSSDLAHELRTPVSNLLTQTQVTLAHPRPSQEYQDILASNAEELERLSRMIADMLLLAKAENGLLIPQIARVDINAEIASLITFYEILADDKGIKLHQEPSVGQGVMVQGDRLMLRRAFSNLLSNALRYTPNGGEVRLEVRPSLNCTTQNVQIMISNTGDPIPPEHLPRLFDRFYRVDTARHHQDNEEGTGLGLAITRSIVMAHQGEIQVVSSPEHTMFMIDLPCLNPPNQAR